MEFMKTVTTRQSCRSFRSEQLNEEQLGQLLCAAYNAPVAMGQTENIHLTLVQDSAVLDRLNAIFAETVGNPDAKPTYGAPTLIVVSAPASAEDILNGANAACVVENMLLAATDLGLGSVFLFGISQATQGNPEIPELLGLDDGFRTVSAIAVGYPSEPLQERDLGVRYATNFI